jgi:hypothetical protein
MATLRPTPARLLVLAALVIALVSVPAGSAAADSFGMRAYGGSGEGEAQELAVFKTAKCKVGKAAKGRKPSFFATGTSTNGLYKVSVSIYFAFTGFHKYALSLDSNADIVLSFYPAGQPSADFANDHVPPFPTPGSGEVRFSPNGKKMRAGFIPVLWNRDASEQVILVGGVECRYPKR